MSHAKRQSSPRLISIINTNGDTLFPQTPAQFFRCEDRPRRIPVGYPMAIRHHITPPQPPIRGEMTARVCAVLALTGMAVVVLGLVSLVGWL